MKQLIIFFIGFLSLCFSCDKNSGNEVPAILVYKFKTTKDFSNNVPVELSDDGSKITSSPGSLNERWPVKLIEGYYLNGSMGVNSGYLSMTREEFNSYDINPGVDTLYKLLVEKDPYLEYYRRYDDGTFRSENGVYGIDTAKINDLIRSDDLENYFDRKK